MDVKVTDQARKMPFAKDKAREPVKAAELRAEQLRGEGTGWRELRPELRRARCPHWTLNTSTQRAASARAELTTPSAAFLPFLGHVCNGGHLTNYKERLEIKGHLKTMSMTL